MNLRCTLLCLMATSFAIAQISFIDILSDPPFFQLHNGSIAFADVDGDGDLDLFMTGAHQSGDYAAYLYINIGVGGQYVLAENTPFVGVVNSDMAFGDLDGDNDQDLIVMGKNESGNPSTSIYFNDANGGFETSTLGNVKNLTLGSLALGDIDNDGDLDLYITGFENEDTFVLSASLYTNDGSGMFTEMPGTNFPALNGSTSRFVDIDNDNDMDLISLGFDDMLSSFFELYKNDGQGNFVLVDQAPFNLGASGTFDLADIEGDGDIDILLLREGSGGNLYTNNGQGSFTEVQNTPFASVDVNIARLAFSDIDNDGDQDVFVSGRNTGQITSRIYENDGLGNYTASIHGNISNILSVDADFGDVDGDLLPELFLMGDNNTDDTPASTLFANHGDGLLQEATTPALEDLSHGDMVFGDIDGDGDQDLVIGGQTVTSGTTTKLYTNNGNGAFTDVENTPFEALSDLGTLVFSDIENDGDLDLFLTENERSLKLYINDGSGTFSDSNVVFDALDEVSAVMVEDIDDDGFDDLLMSGSKTMSVLTVLLRNTGMVSFNQEIVIPGSLSNFYIEKLDVADVDGDLDYDLVVMGINDGTTLQTNLFLNDGNGSFSLKTGTPFSGLSAGTVDFFDCDSDGDVDLLQTGNTGLTGGGDDQTKLFKNDGAGNFLEETQSTFFNASSGAVGFGDIEGDGHVDVLITGEENTFYTAKLYANDGTGNFAEVTNIALLGVRSSAVAFSDIDGDGDQDILISGEEAITTGPNTQIYANETPQVSLSVEKAKNLPADFIIYPNPNNTQRLYVELQEGYHAETTLALEIYDLMGRVVLEEKTIRIHENRLLEIELPKLAGGQYFISIRHRKQKAAKGFVVE